MAILLFLVKCYLLTMCIMGTLYWAAFRIKPEIIDTYRLRDGNRLWTTVRLMLLAPVAMIAALVG